MPPRTLNSPIPGQVNAQNAQNSAPQGVDRFNLALIDLLKRYQTLGTKPFAEQGYNAQEAQNRRILAQSDLIGASPSQQASARSSYAGALDPTIQGARQSQQTFGEQLRTFGDAVESVRNFTRDYTASQEKAKADARENLLLAMDLGGPEGLDAIKKENPNIFKIAGLDEETIIASAKAKAKREQESKKSYSTVDLGDRVGVFDNQGNLVRSIAKGVDPGTRSSGDTSLTATQKAAGDKLDAVLTSLDSYKKLYSSLVGRTGVNLAGSDAGSLSGAYNALIFQIAEAAGTGALQAADREVVEAMIPNPTTVGGAIGGFTKGGKQGGINAIDEARKIFVNKKNTIGNSPTSSGAGQTRVVNIGGTNVTYTKGADGLWHR